MRIDGSWVPESDAELELFDNLHKAKVKAFDEGVDPDQIAAAMSYMASTSLVSKPEDNKNSLQEEIEKEKQKADNCPECGQEIETVLALGIGGEHKVHPCGHSFEWDEAKDKLGEWIDDPVENNE